MNAPFSLWGMNLNFIFGKKKKGKGSHSQRRHGGIYKCMFSSTQPQTLSAISGRLWSASGTTFNLHILDNRKTSPAPSAIRTLRRPANNTVTTPTYLSRPCEFINNVHLFKLSGAVQGSGLSWRTTGFDPGPVHVALGQGFLNISVCPYQHHSTNAPHSPSTKYCSHQKDKQAKTGNLQASFSKWRKILYFITVLYMFRATSCSSSGGQIVLVQHLVSSLSVSDRPVHRLREFSLNLCTGRPLTEWHQMLY